MKKKKEKKSELYINEILFEIEKKKKVSHSAIFIYLFCVI